MPARTDWYLSKNRKHRRITVFGLLYAGDQYIKIKDHHPHGKSFMSHLDALIANNPQWGKYTQLDTAGWTEVKEVLKAMW